MNPIQNQICIGWETSSRFIWKLGKLITPDKFGARSAPKFLRVYGRCTGENIHFHCLKRAQTVKKKELEFDFWKVGKLTEN